ncbi:MAG: MFS transporter [Phycisphaeraceae bacterium]|nr:MAG: MFS transporter [Phycisphaeraceae bacterium]
MKKLNPFRGLDNPREVWAWGMYDLANQSFTLLIITLLFPIYFKKVVVGDEARGDALWSIAGSGSLLLVVLLSPFVGACADAWGAKKKILMITGALCAVLTIALGGLGAGDVAAAIVLFAAANLCYQLGENTLAGFLPEIATARNIGRVSATGWSMGYAGALVLQIIVVVAMLTLGLKSESRWAPFFVLAGVWFALGMIAPAVVLRETPARTLDPSAGSVFGAALSRLVGTARQASHYKQLVRFLLAFFVYALGVQTIIYFAGIIARDFGLVEEQLMIFALQLTLTAGAAAIVTGFVQDRIGARTTVMIFLGVWIATALGLLALTLIPADVRADNQWAFWIVGNGVGIGLGGIGTASRSMVGRFTPRHKTAEFFGLWGMTYKFAGVVGVSSFGLVKAGIGEAASMGLLAGFFVVGLVLLVRVSESAGVRAAKRVDRDAAGAGGAS